MTDSMVREPDELNLKIGLLINSLGFSSSRFADYIEVSRPIISHIIAGRNKPSLEIIQRILKKFPELGISWTFDGEEFDTEMLNKIALRVDAEQREHEMKRLRESGIWNDINSSPEILAAQTAHIENSMKLSGIKRITKIVVFYNDNSFTEFNPA